MAKLSESFTTTVIGNFQDLTDQDPAGVGFSNAVNVTWGAGGNTINNEITVGADGVITVNNSDSELYFTANFRVSRETSAGVANVVIWYEASTDSGVNWETRGSSIDVVMGSTDVSTRDAGIVYVPRGTAIGTLFRVRVGRYDGSNDSGSLLPRVLTGTFAGVPAAPSAELRIEKKEAL